jgi:hypothetical protein
MKLVVFLHEMHQRRLNTYNFLCTILIERLHRSVQLFILLTTHHG